MAAKSFMSFRKTVALTTWPRLLPAGLKNGFEVLHGSRRLFLDSAGNDLAGHWIQTALAGGEDKVSCTHALRIRADRRRRAVGGDIRASHGSIL